jgi:isoleucyl-tRNA synthetase
MREVVRLIQEGRKSAGFEVSDRIKVSWSASGQTLEAIKEYEGAIRDEVLATSFVESPNQPADALRDEEIDFACTLTRV